jgi:hypothetical protein
MFPFPLHVRSRSDFLAFLFCRPINSICASLATEVLDSLSLFLRDPSDSRLTDVQKLLRPAVSLQQMFRIIDLGATLDQIVVKHHISCQSNNSCSSYSEAEKALW